MTQVIYVSSPESQQIYVWKLNQKYGILELIQIIFTPGQAHPTVVHPNKKFLYVGIRPDFKIITYSINNIGLLKNIRNIKIFSSPTYLMSNIEGTYLYCISYQYSTVSIFPIHTSGIIAEPIQIIKNLLGCHSIGIDKYKRLAWIPCLKEDTIHLFKIDKSGILTEFNPKFIKSSNFLSGPRHIIFHNTAYYVYIINELNNTIDIINYGDPQKTPYVVQTINVVPESIMFISKYWGSDIHIVPNGDWLYCTDRIANVISCFKISCKTKQLTFINYQSTELQPRGFAIDSTGKFLIVAGQKSHHISLYSINPDNGKLVILSRYYSGKGPMWVNIVTLN